MHQDARAARNPWILPALAMAVAAAARAARVAYGLPDFLEEAIPLRIALDMRDAATGAVDWNPHHFNYPSLSIYLHFLVQQLVYGVGHALGRYASYADYRLAFDLDPTPMVLAARMLSIAADLGALLAAIRIGNRILAGAGVIAGIFCAVTPLLVTTSTSVFCDTLMVAAALWAVERLFAWGESRRLRDLDLAAVLAGLAVGAKYPAALLILPAALMVWRKDRAGSPRLLFSVTLIAALTFIATTPFAIFDFKTFLEGVLFESRHAAAGHFGSLQHTSFRFHFGQLTGNLGWVSVAALALSLGVAAVRRGQRLQLACLWTLLLAFGTPIALARIDAQRYLVPVLYFAALLIGTTFADFFSRSGPGQKWLIAAGLAIALAAPLGGAADLLGKERDTTQLLARKWCEQNLEGTALVILEGYTARLPTVLQKNAGRAGAVYPHASPAWQRRFDAVRAFHAVSLPLHVAGEIHAAIPLANGKTTDLTVLAHSSDLSRVYYEPALYSGAGYFMTSAAVRARFEADSARYAVECDFYRWLDTRATRVAEFRSGARVDGPEIRLYDIRDAVRSLAGPAHADPWWWIAAIPPAARAAAETASTAPSPRSVCDLGLPSPPPAARALQSVYVQHVERLVLDLATEHSLLGRPELAQQLSALTVSVDDRSIEAWQLYCVGAAGRRDWRGVLRASACALESMGGRPDAGLQFLHARALAETGARDAATAEFESLAAKLGPADPVGAAALKILGPRANREPIQARRPLVHVRPASKGGR